MKTAIIVGVMSATIVMAGCSTAPTSSISPPVPAAAIDLGTVSMNDGGANNCTLSGGRDCRVCLRALADHQVLVEVVVSRKDVQGRVRILARPHTIANSGEKASLEIDEGSVVALIPEVKLAANYSERPRTIGQAKPIAMKWSEELDRQSLATSANGAENASTNTLRLETVQGGRVRIAGTIDSPHREWRAEGRQLSGFVELGPAFPLRAMKQAKPGKAQARLYLAIGAMGLKTVAEDGSPHGSNLDGLMHEVLRAEQTPKILFYSHELTLRDPAKDKKSPVLLDAEGDLVVAGVTNTVSLPVTMTPLNDGRWRLSSKTLLKMTAFGIVPPANQGLTQRTQFADQVKVTCDWIVAPIR